MDHTTGHIFVETGAACTSRGNVMEPMIARTELMNQIVHVSLKSYVIIIQMNLYYGAFLLIQIPLRCFVFD